MNAPDSWDARYMEEKFSVPDPWKYFSSPYEQKKYQRQLDVIKDRHPEPQRILEIGSAEGAYTLLLADNFPSAKITAVEISAQAASRARVNLRPFLERVKIVNADILDCAPRIRDASIDVCLWSESVYYLGARLPLARTYALLQEVAAKLLEGGLLVMANAVELPEDVAEASVTQRPLMDCYYNLLSSLISPAEKAVYVEEKQGRIYEYQVWAFQR
jgi:spermidine synthase